MTSLVEASPPFHTSRKQRQTWRTRYTAATVAILDQLHRGLAPETLAAPVPDSATSADEAPSFATKGARLSFVRDLSLEFVL